MKYLSSCLLLSVSLLWTITASAAPIPGLFNTGLSASRTLLGAGVTDPHYKLIVSPDLAFPGPNARVVNEGSPIPPWLTNGPDSKWIAPQAAQSAGNQPGDYTYRTTFDLTGLDPTNAILTGQWSTDNAGVDILLNGVSTANGNSAQFASWTSFTLSAALGPAFNQGTNTLDFVVNNAAPGANPTGLRVEVGGTADVLPPGTPPTILRPPTSQTVAPEDSVSFGVMVRGSAPLSYQWRFNESNISKATNATYTIATAFATNAGAYDVVVSNDAGTVTSVAATLSLTNPNLTPAQLTYEPLGPSSRRTPIVISEIMYHPAPRADGKNLEFIELYNSNPFREDISGFRLTGEFDYTFPPGTVLGGNSFLVVAPQPAELQSVYGIAGVLGGFTNTLPNDIGTLRLLKSSGAIVLEVSYADEMPWPVAADGTGHSLVLARASYGHQNPYAWAASARVGGSPGGPDPVPAAPVENVVINEILARTEPPLEDFIELYNHSFVEVDLSGCWLSDDPATNKFRVPDGTTIPAGGFLAFPQTQLGFALSAAGESVFFVSSNQTRVVDAIRFGAQAEGVSSGRVPDGAPSWHGLAARTPGAANAPLRIEDVVINEIMYHPISGQIEDEFVELYNRGTNTAKVGGWKFLNGIRFTFPASTVIPAGGYLVVAKSAARLALNYPGLTSANLVGDFSGTLSHGGERLTLARPDVLVFSTGNPPSLTTNLLDLVVDEVTYGTGGRWGQWAGGGGSSLELIDARADHRLGPNWADSDETAKSAWTEIEYTGRLDLGFPAVGANQLQVFLEGAGEALVDNVEVFSTNGVNRVSNSNFESGSTGWVFQGTQRATSWETNGGFNSARSLHLRASDRGDHVANRARTALTSAVTANQLVTIRAKVKWLRGHPEILFRVFGNGAEAVGRLAVPANLGTPGAPNSRALNNAGPAITEVSHRPALPQAGKSIQVTARVQDPDGVPSVILRYRVDPSATLADVVMVDDGTGGDTVARDGIFTGTIPGQASGKLIAFRLEATDGFSPVATTQFPEDAPRRECLVRVGDATPKNAFGTYRFWITLATQNFWASREKMSNEALDATFVYGPNRIVYNAGVEYSGSSYTAPIYDSPVGALCGYNIFFPEDDAVLGETHFTLDWPIRDDTDQREQLMFWFLEQLGLPNNYRRYVNLYVNGLKRGAIYDDIQQPASDLIKEWFPADADGHLYKTDCWNEFDASGNRIDPCILNSLENFTTLGGVKKTARYRWNWRPRVTSNSANEFDDLFSLVDAMNVPGSGFQAAVEAQVDVEHWCRTFCMNDLASFWDAFGNPNAKNTYLYKPRQDRWKLFSWDFDVGLGVFNDPFNDPLFPSLGDPTMNRFYANPAFLRAYWRSMEEALQGFFRTGAGTAIDAILDAKYAAFQANAIQLSSPVAIKSWILQRRTFLQGELNRVSTTFAVNGPGEFSTNLNLITLTGRAPVAAKTICVNGIAYPLTWTSVTNWALRVPLHSGPNVLAVQAYDRLGQALIGLARTVTVQYTEPDPAPEDWLVINEIMYHPAVPDASYVEIYNRSTNYTFDLSSWRLDGVGFTFPAGTIITNGQFLLVAKSRAAFGATYGVGIPLVGEFFGQLDEGGETLSLIEPGATAAEDRIVDRVAFAPDAPWPLRPDGLGSSLQLIDATRDNRRVSNWSDGAGAWGSPVPLNPVPFTPGTTNSGAAALPPYAALWLSEVQPENVSGITDGHGEHAPWIEIYNAGTDALSLAGYFLADNYTNVTQWPFPEGATIGPGQFLIIWADGEPGESQGSEWHTNFRLNPGIGSVALARGLNSGPQLLDYLNYRGVGPDRSYGSAQAGEPSGRQTFYYVTPGAMNNPASPPVMVFINEWMADNASTLKDPVDQQFQDWFELYNPSASPVDLSNCTLTDSLNNPGKFKIPSGTTIAPHGFLLVWADAETEQNASAGDLHVNFKLSLGGELIALHAPDGRLVDQVSFGSQTTDVSQGRWPDGHAAPFYLMSKPTPRSANDIPNGPV